MLNAAIMSETTVKSDEGDNTDGGNIKLGSTASAKEHKPNFVGLFFRFSLTFCSVKMMFHYS